MVKTIHCYAEGRDGDWEAFCLDFDIAVQGESFTGVCHSLSEGIALYLDYVKNLPEEERGAFLNRRAPLSFRIKVLWYAFLAAFGRQTNVNERHEFTALCPM